MGGGKDGGKGGGDTAPNINIQPSPYEQALARISNEVYDTTKPLRNVFLEDWMNFLRPPGASGGTAGTTTTTTRSGPYPYQGGTYPGYDPSKPVGPDNDPLLRGGYGNIPDPNTFQYGNLFNRTSQQGLNDARVSQGLEAEKPSPYPAKEWFDYWQNPTNISTQTSNLSPTAKVVGFYNNPSERGTGYAPAQMQSPIFEVAPGRYFTREGTEWFGSPSEAWWGEGYTPSLPGAVANPGGSTTTTTTTGGTSGTGGYGPYSPYSLPGYAPLYQMARQGIESQFNQARQNTLANSVRGGGLQDSLTNLEINRAIQSGSLPAQISAPIIQDIINKAYGASWNAPQTSIAGLAGAESGYANRYGSTLNYMTGSNALGASGAASMGSGLGGLASMGSKGGGGKGGGGDMFSGASASMSMF